MPGYNNQHLIDGMIHTFLTVPFPDKGPDTDEYKATVDLVTKIAVPVHEHIVSWWNDEGGGLFIDELVKMDALDPISGYLGSKIDNDTLKFNTETFKLYVNSIPAATTSKSGGVIVGASASSVLYLQGEEIMARVNTQATLSVSDVEIPSCRAVKLYVDNAIQSIGQGGGIGDMLKSTYDTNNNGIVDDSEKLNNQLGSYYLSWNNHTDKPSTYAPSSHGLLTHTVSGLTTGYFLKALSSTTYGFAAHGLTANDLGAADYSHTHGNISSSGRIGSTQYLPIITGSSGLLEVGSFGSTQYSFCEGNDSRVNNGQLAYEWGDHAASNYHTGIGTSGYLAKYTGNYSQGNSIIYDDGNAAQVGSITAGKNLRTYSTEGAEECPALTTGNWTLGAGWQYLTLPNRLDKNIDGTGTATVLTGSASIANTTYKVELTVDSITGTFVVAIGATYLGIINSIGTKVFYRTATTTAKLIITPTATTARITISATSIKPLSNGAIDVDGRLTMKGDIWDSTGITLLKFANYNGNAHVAIGTNPIANYPLTVNGYIYAVGRVYITEGYINTMSSNTRTTYTTGAYIIANTVANATYTVQWSPMINLYGYAWNTTPTAASKANSMYILVKPVSGTTTYPTLSFAAGTVDGVASNTEVMLLSYNGNLSITGDMNLVTGKTYNINGVPHTHDLTWQTAPSTKTSTGVEGQIARDSNYFYICIATNTWVRTPMLTNW